MISDFTSPPITHYPDGTWVVELTVRPEVQAERRAVLLGDDAVARLRAEQEQRARLGAAARQRDRRLARAIRRMCG